MLKSDISFERLTIRKINKIYTMKSLILAQDER